MNSSALKGMLVILLVLIALASGIYYTIVTKFGSSKPAVLESLERENDIIRKQIEKKELLSKLESFEKNEQ